MPIMQRVMDGCMKHKVKLVIFDNCYKLDQKYDRRNAYKPAHPQRQGEGGGRPNYFGCDKGR